MKIWRLIKDREASSGQPSFPCMAFLFSPLPSFTGRAYLHHIIPINGLGKVSHESVKRKEEKEII